MRNPNQYLKTINIQSDLKGFQIFNQEAGKSKPGTERLQYSDYDPKVNRVSIEM